jgi:branched-chain amino acid transport system substrate-binding protein
MLGRSTAAPTVKASGDTWFFITADYAFGKQLQADTTAFIKEAGGVVGSVAYPFPGTSDFGPFLLQAQASGAKVLGLANAGADLVTCIKQAKELGTSDKMKMAALNMFICDVKSLGLKEAAGLLLTESFNWDLNDRTRAFTKRVLPNTPQNWPGMAHAGAYAGKLHYLKAVAKVGAVAAKKRRCYCRISHEIPPHRRRCIWALLDPFRWQVFGAGAFV